MSFNKLIEKIVETQNPAVVGLDPKLDFIPEFIKQRNFDKYGNTLLGASNAILEFNKIIIDNIYDIVPAIKPQCAYYEMYGYQGVWAMEQTIDYAKSRGIYVITDGKRNDIGTTMEAYAIGHLGEVNVNGETIQPFKGDSLTVNGYIGSDGIDPLIKICDEYDKGIFVLVKTSNPSSGELQDLFINDKPVYEVMGQMCEKWGEDLKGDYGYSGVGAVVGATYPEMLKELRNKMPKTFFLVPGYGAQGGTAKDVAKAFDKNGLGAIINSSRAIMCAYQNENYSEQDFGIASRDKALEMKQDILKHIGEIKIGG